MLKNLKVTFTHSTVEKKKQKELYSVQLSTDWFAVVIVVLWGLYHEKARQRTTRDCTALKASPSSGSDSASKC